MNILKKEFGDITHSVNDVQSYLGMLIEKLPNEGIKVSMDAYIGSILEENKVEGSAVTPATIDLFKLDESELLNDIEKSKFHTITAKLLYASKRVRIDIQTAVAFLCTRVNAPNIGDWNKLQRVLKYLNAYPNEYLILNADRNIHVELFVDASWGSHPIGGRSHTGVFLTIGGGPIYTKSSKQKMTCASSTEAELVALMEGVSITLWLMKFLKAQGENVTYFDIYEDNKGVVALINGDMQQVLQQRHYNVKYNTVRDLVKKYKTARLTYCPTDKMWADFLSKALQGSSFREMSSVIMNSGTSNQLKMKGVLSNKVVAIK